MAGRSAQVAPQRKGGAVDHGDQQQHGEQHGAGLAHVKEPEVVAEHLAQAAGADDAEHGGGADVVLPAVQGVGEQLRQDLRQGGPEQDAGGADAVAAQGVRWFFSWISAYRGSFLHDKHRSSATA